MIRNKPICWGYIIERKEPKVKWVDVEIPECPCRLNKSCLRRSNKFTRIINKAINRGI